MPVVGSRSRGLGPKPWSTAEAVFLAEALQGKENQKSVTRYLALPPLDRFLPSRVNGLGPLYRNGGISDLSQNRYLDLARGAPSVCQN